MSDHSFDVHQVECWNCNSVFTSEDEGYTRRGEVELCGSCAALCLECGHASHHGRCFVIKDMAYCPCKHKEKHDGDSVLGNPEPLRGVAGIPAVQDMAQCYLAAADQELREACTDILAQIDEIGRTMTEGAAQMRGEGR